jgi:hypothetical protein
MSVEGGETLSAKDVCGRSSPCARPGAVAPKEKLPVEIRKVNRVHIDDINVAEAHERLAGVGGRCEQRLRPHAKTQRTAYSPPGL